MRSKSFDRLAACGIVGLALMGAVTLGAPANAKPVLLFSGSDAKGVGEGSAIAPPGGAGGWQGEVNVDVSGFGSYFFHYACPSSVPTPISGGISPNPTAYAGMSLIGNYNRGNGEWGWVTTWSQGAPSGSVITYNVYCKKK